MAHAIILMPDNPAISFYLLPSCPSPSPLSLSHKAALFSAFPFNMF